MRVDVDHADRPVPAERLQDRVGDRMVAADRQRNHVGGADLREEGLDVRVALLEAEPALHRHVADVGDGEMRSRRDPQRVLVGPDALDRAHRARAEPRAGPVGDAEIHRHADERDIEPAEIRPLRKRLGPERQRRGTWRDPRTATCAARRRRTPARRPPRTPGRGCRRPWRRRTCGAARRASCCPWRYCSARALYRQTRGPMARLDLGQAKVSGARDSLLTIRWTRSCTLGWMAP